ncbi:MAG: hypothetical protein LBG80_20135 [Bacteroidales bacterium]|jgi:hypothetical protein|nr:hypothetical protein [Bacteroidales bacterium]
MNEVKVLVKPEKEIYAQDVEGYCELSFSCGMGQSCGFNFVNTDEEEDILF